MAPEEEDLYDEEFDFVDDDETDDDEDGVDDDYEADQADEAEDDEQADSAAEGEGDSAGDEEVDEYGRPEPVANYVVHVYEYNKFKRTIDRPFTPEDAEAFATEYNRTSKPYGRQAVPGKNDVDPKKSISARATNPD